MRTELMDDKVSSPTLKTWDTCIPMQFVVTLSPHTQSTVGTNTYPMNTDSISISAILSNIYILLLNALWTYAKMKKNGIVKETIVLEWVVSSTLWGFKVVQRPWRSHYAMLDKRRWWCDSRWWQCDDHTPACHQTPHPTHSSSRLWRQSWTSESGKTWWGPTSIATAGRDTFIYSMRCTAR